MRALLWPPRGGRAQLALVAMVIVAFAFWRALFAGGSLVSADIVAVDPPFEAEFPDDFVPEVGPGDPINIHAHWGSLAEDIRSGDASWWDQDLAAGQPTMKGGLPVFDLIYLIVPVWFAPGLVAVVRTLTAIGLTALWTRSLGARPIAALVAGLAYGFSGFMVGWMNWPHSSVAALAPGLMWSVERLVSDRRLWRAVPLGGFFAAMVWSNFPQVTIYLMLAAVLYGIIRLGAEVGRGELDSGRDWAGLLGVVGAGAAIGIALALPHVVSFAEYLDWADTSHRIEGAEDSSAGVMYLLTAVAPVAFGSDGVDPRWFGAGNWVEFQSFLGVSVVILAALAVTTRLDGSLAARRRVAALAALAVIGALGVLVAYVGGRLGTAINDVVGDRGGLATRSKVLIALAAAPAAGLGLDVWTGSWTEEERRRVGRATLWAAAGLAVVGLVMIPALRDWFDLARSVGLTRQVLGASTVSVVVAFATLAALVARWIGWIEGRTLGWVMVGVVSFELLSFAMPVPTTAERDERLAATDSHAQVLELLEPGERLGGEGTTFWPATTALFDVPDIRGQLLKSEGYQELLGAVDERVFENAFGGTPTYPYIQADTDPASPVWDAMGVGVWSQFPSTFPPGPVEIPPPGATGVDTVDGPHVTSIVVPEGGLRAIVLELGVSGRTGGLVTVRVEADGQLFETSRRRVEMTTGLSSFAIPGDDLTPGVVAQVSLTSDGPEGFVLVAVDETGEPVVGWVAGTDDGLRVAAAGPVTLIERSEASFARVFDAALVREDVVDAVSEVLARTGEGPHPAVVDEDVELPSTPDPDARLQAITTRAEGGSVDVGVSADRNALVAVAVADYPGWSATIDGESAQLVRVDAAFIGVVVPAGDHQVEFRFRPRHLGGTGAVAAVGALVSLVLLIRPGGPLRRGPTADR